MSGCPGRLASIVGWRNTANKMQYVSLKTGTHFMESDISKLGIRHNILEVGAAESARPGEGAAAGTSLNSEKVGGTYTRAS